MGSISSSGRNQISGSGVHRRWRARPTPPAASVSVAAGPPAPARPLHPAALLHPWCTSGDERRQIAAAHSGVEEQRYLASSASDYVAISILGFTRDYLTFAALAGRHVVQIRRQIAPQLIKLGVIDGGSTEDVLSILADDESSLVRSGVAAAATDPALRRHLAEDPSHDVRRTVLSGTEDPGLYALLAADPHPYVRATVAHGTRDIALLVGYLDDEDPWVRSRAAERLRLLNLDA